MRLIPSSGKLASAGAISAIAASLCCIAPVLVLLAGTSGLASIFSWIEPIRPYLIGVSVLVLGFAWYQKLKPVQLDECGCVLEEKSSFIQSKIFLILVTIFTVLMLTVPYYSKVFFSKHGSEIEEVDQANTQTVEFIVTGMTCAACEEHIKHEVYKLPGIINASVSYDKSSALIQFDATKTTHEEIKRTINSTGYTVTQ